MSKNIKLIIFDVGLVTTSVFLSLTFGQAFTNASLDLVGNLAGINTFLLIGSAFVLLGITGSIVSFFSPDFNRLALGFLASGLAFFAFLTGLGNLFVRLGLAGIFTAALFIFAAFVRSDNESVLKFSVRKVFLPSLKKLGILTTLIFCTGFFFSYRSRIELEGFKAPVVLIDKVIELTGQKLIEAFTSQIVSTSKLPDQEAVFVEIPEELDEAGLTKTLEEEFGIKIDRVPQDSADLLSMIKPALRDRIASQIEEMLNPYLPFIPAIMSILFFLSLFPFATIGAFVVVPCLALAFKVLGGLKLIEEKEETVSVTRLILN